MTAVLTGSDVAARISQAVPNAVLEVQEDAVVLESETVPAVCRLLKDTPDYAFDFLEAVSAVDFIDHFQVVYHLLSLQRNHSIVLKTRVYSRDEPTVPSVTSVWGGANVQEREIYDLMGVHFRDHPNMKRILTWDGFEGHPHRKDFL